MSTATRSAQIYFAGKERILVAMCGRRIDNHVAAGNSFVKMFKPRRQFAYVCCNGGEEGMLRKAICSGVCMAISLYFVRSHYSLIGHGAHAGFPSPPFGHA